MVIELTLNGIPRTFEVPPGLLLGELLRREGLVEDPPGGEAGVGPVLVEGRTRSPEIMLAAQAHGREVALAGATGFPEEPEAVEAEGALTPAVLAAAYEALFENPRPPA